MEAKHTPGPWKTEPRFPFVRIVADGAPCVAETGGWNDREREEMHANARLIAAAPDLLAAVEEILMLSLGDFSTTDWNEAFKQCHAAAIKARGEA